MTYTWDIWKPRFNKILTVHKIIKFNCDIIQNYQYTFTIWSCWNGYSKINSVLEDLQWRLDNDSGSRMPQELPFWNNKDMSCKFPLVLVEYTHQQQSVLVKTTTSFKVIEKLFFCRFTLTRYSIELINLRLTDRSGMCHMQHLN